MQVALRYFNPHFSDLALILRNHSARAFLARGQLNSNLKNAERNLTLAWSGMLTFMTHEMEWRVPELAKANTLLDSIRERINEMEKFRPRLDDGIEPADNALFPARLKPGPRG